MRATSFAAAAKRTCCCSVTIAIVCIPFLHGTNTWEAGYGVWPVSCNGWERHSSSGRRRGPPTSERAAQRGDQVRVIMDKWSIKCSGVGENIFSGLAGCLRRHQQKLSSCLTNFWWRIVARSPVGCSPRPRDWASELWLCTARPTEMPGT